MSAPKEAIPNADSKTRKIGAFYFFLIPYASSAVIAPSTPARVEIGKNLLETGTNGMYIIANSTMVTAKATMDKMPA